MFCSLKCKCGATAMTKGYDEPEINYFNVDDSIEIIWENGSPECEHDDFEITETWHEEP